MKSIYSLRLYTAVSGDFERHWLNIIFLMTIVINHINMKCLYFFRKVIHIWRRRFFLVLSTDRLIIKIPEGNYNFCSVTCCWKCIYLCQLWTLLCVAVRLGSTTETSTLCVIISRWGERDIVQCVIQREIHVTVRLRWDDGRVFWIYPFVWALP